MNSEMLECPLIVTLDEQHCYINGWLLDMVAINAWLRSRTWPPHSPKADVEELSRRVKRLHDRPELCCSEHVIWALLACLSSVTCNGYYVPDQPFEVSPGLPFYRLEKQMITWRQTWLPKDVRQISKRWKERGKWKSKNNTQLTEA